MWDKPKVYDIKIYCCDHCGFGSTRRKDLFPCIECGDYAKIHTYTGVLTRWPDPSSNKTVTSGTLALLVACK